ncbi:MAG: pyruvate, orthophosphate dikinase [Microbacteriaceae bacterium]|nr:pyruvate, orthophosphate dikinase [Microbacteriaceae bacterium]
MTQYSALLSLSGWCTSRHPVSGNLDLTGRFTASPLRRDVADWLAMEPLSLLAARHHDAWEQLSELANRLEREHRAPVQFEFELAKDRAWPTRVRNARIQPLAYVTAIHDLVRAGVMSPGEAVLAVTPEQVRACLTPTVVPTADGLLGVGLGVSPGAGSGRVVFSSDEAGLVGASGGRCVLVVGDSRPDDFGARRYLAGVVALRGGATSHAAVVAKGLGLPMIAGLRDAVLDSASGVLRIGGRAVSRLDVVTVDGSQGHLYPAGAPVTDGSMTPALAELIGWADEFRMIEVHANADSGEDVRTAKELGASGVGLCRLEHVLAAGGGTAQLRKAFAQKDPAARARAVEDMTRLLTTLLTDTLLAADGVPVTVRLLDVPRHELVDGSARETDPTAGLAEVNPKMGARGVRDFLVNANLGVAQVAAIARSCRAVAELGLHADVRILVPMVGFSEEFRRARQVVECVFEREAPGGRASLPAVGCMIEVPRIALNAAELAAHADFLSIGSNDLTQFMLAVSRDDAEVGFLGSYVRDQVIAANPFECLDREGVGRILRICIDEARGRRPDLPIGLCGEHAGDPASVEYLVSLGLDYLSCSPRQIPLARFSAGRATLMRSTVAPD